MIKSFANQNTLDIYDGKNTKKARKTLPSQLHHLAGRKLDMLHASTCLDDLKLPPSNQLEKLKGDRKDQYSIRINGQYRIVFKWKHENIENVEIVDYHK